MTTSQLTPLEAEILESKELSPRAITYFQERLRNRLHETVLKEYLRQHDLNGTRKSQIALRLGKDPAQITRWLGAPGNWTIDTISDLLIAMGNELSLGVRQVASQAAQASDLDNIVNFTGEYKISAGTTARASTENNPQNDLYISIG